MAVKVALCAIVARYRARGAIRGVGQALGLPEDVIKALSSGMWSWSEVDNVRELNLNPDDCRLVLALKLAQRLKPPHPCQHPGGIVLTHDQLDDLVPEPATIGNGVTRIAALTRAGIIWAAFDFHIPTLFSAGLRELRSRELAQGHSRLFPATSRGLWRWLLSTHPRDPMPLPMRWR
jgi:hypothetical protein